MTQETDDAVLSAWFANADEDLASDAFLEDLRTRLQHAQAQSRRRRIWIAIAALATAALLASPFNDALTPLLALVHAPLVPLDAELAATGVAPLNALGSIAAGLTLLVWWSLRRGIA